MEKRKISIIVPCYNEQAVLEITYTRLVEEMKTVGDNYEIVMVNDGSRDATHAIITRLAASDPRIVGVCFSRNFGHEAAVSAGIKHCSGELAFIIDADLQDDPRHFAKMLDVMNAKQCDAVYGVRMSREGETFMKKLTAKWFYRTLNWLSDVEFPVDTGHFRLINAKIITAFKGLDERNKFCRGLLTWVGYKQEPYYYERDQRAAGETKYNYKRMFALASRGIFGFSNKPLRLAAYFGLLSIAFAFLLILYVLFDLNNAIRGWASTVTIILFFGGVQLLCLSIIGQYIANIYDEVKKRPEFIVGEIINKPTANN